MGNGRAWGARVLKGGVGDEGACGHRAAHHLAKLIEADAARLVGVDHLEQVEPVARLRVREDVLDLLRALPRQVDQHRLGRRQNVHHAVTRRAL